MRLDLEPIKNITVNNLEALVVAPGGPRFNTENSEIGILHIKRDASNRAERSLEVQDLSTEEYLLKLERNGAEEHLTHLNLQTDLISRKKSLIINSILTGLLALTIIAGIAIAFVFLPPLALLLTKIIASGWAVIFGVCTVSNIRMTLEIQQQITVSKNDDLDYQQRIQSCINALNHTDGSFIRFIQNRFKNNMPVAINLTARKLLDMHRVYQDITPQREANITRLRDQFINEINN